jgi:hypothetical protein
MNTSEKIDALSNRIEARKKASALYGIQNQFWGISWIVGGIRWLGLAEVIPQEVSERIRDITHQIGQLTEEANTLLRELENKLEGRE